MLPLVWLMLMESSCLVVSVNVVRKVRFKLFVMHVKMMCQVFKGRKCVEKVNREYRLMQSDMYNLYPAIGAVNALRQNYNFQMLPGEEPDFGSCGMKIADRRAEPPIRARGQIARTYKYMADAYAPRYRMSRQQAQLMDAWDRMYPVDAWECTRAKRIENLQGNENPFVKRPCREARLW